MSTERAIIPDLQGWMLRRECRWQEFTTTWVFVIAAVIVVRSPAVRRLGQVRHQWQVEEPVGKADEDRREPRPDLRAHPPVRVRSTRRGGRDSTAEEQSQAHQGDDYQYPRSCHTGVSPDSPLTVTGPPLVFRKRHGRDKVRAHSGRCGGGSKVCRII